MVDFSALKTHVTSRWVNDSEMLRLGSKPSGQAQADVKVGSSFGRIVNWVLPDPLTGNRHERPSNTGLKVRNEFLIVEHEAVRTQVKDALIGQFSAPLFEAASKEAGWSLDKPLTAREVRLVIQNAEKLQESTTSNVPTGHPSDGRSGLEDIAQRETRNVPHPNNPEALPEQFKGEAHEDFRMRMLDAMMDKFSDNVLNQVSRVVDWSSNAPLTEQEVSTFIKAAEHARDSAPATATTSNAHTGHYSDGNRLGDLTRLGTGKVNVVSSATFMQNSEEREMVFKPQAEKAPEKFPFHGIQTRENLGNKPGATDIPLHGNVIGRNIASYEIAHALGMPEMITQTLQTRQGGVEGIAMAKAEGAPVFSTTGKLNFNTAFSPDEIEQKTNHWNEQLAKHHLVITGHTGSQVHLQKLNLESNIKKAVELTTAFMIQKFGPGRTKGIEVSEGEVLNRPGNLTHTEFESITEKHAQLMYRAKRVLTLPVDHKGLITDEKLNRDLNRLQWLDFVCGQGDRNPSNLFIQYATDGKVTGLTGIDNDFSFGEWVSDKGIHPDGDTSKIETGVAYQGMPKNAIDAETAQKIQSLHSRKEQFQAMLKANGMTPNEIAAATKRLETASQQITAWETGGDKASHILPANAPQWKMQNAEGYSAYFSSMRVKARFVASNQVSPTELGHILS